LLLGQDSKSLAPPNNRCSSALPSLVELRGGRALWLRTTLGGNARARSFLTQCLRCNACIAIEMHVHVRSGGGKQGGAPSARAGDSLVKATALTASTGRSGAAGCRVGTGRLCWCRLGVGGALRRLNLDHGQPNRTARSHPARPMRAGCHHHRSAAVIAT
jgi:hypothetical protein